MLNCDKAILAAYINVDNLSASKAMYLMTQIRSHITSEYKKEFDICDDSLIIIVLPVKNQPTKIELLNARYPEYEKILEESKKIYEELKNKPEDE